MAARSLIQTVTRQWRLGLTRAKLVVDEVGCDSADLGRNVRFCFGVSS